MSVKDHEKARVTQLLDSLLNIQAALVRREVDADREPLREQQEEFDAAYEIATQEILEVVARARCAR